MSPERRAQVIRGSAAGCLATGVALMIWLGTVGERTPTAPVAPSILISSLAPIEGTQQPSRQDIQPAARPLVLTPREAQSRGLVTTAQILAVAERFVATGDVLAARAMLNDTAAAGDPHALFALAETYDPNLLASWNATNIEPSPAYARQLYEAARRGGVADAQTRLDALR